MASQDDDFDEPMARDAGYVGPQACAPCHAVRVSQFAATRHYRACCQPQATAMAPGFAAGRGSFAIREPAVRFEMTREGSDFFQTDLRPKIKNSLDTPLPVASWVL